MASIVSDPNGTKRILFVAPDGKRRTIRSGKVDRRTAEAVARHVEALLASRISGQPIPRETACWLGTVGEKLKQRLAAVGLIDAPARVLLGQFLTEYVLNRKDVKASTLEVWQQPARNLTEFFGADKPIRDITPGEAEQFAQWLRTQNLASATVAKRLSFARTFFHVARKHRLIDENQFCEVKIPPANVTARQRFIDRDTVQRLLDAAPPVWRTIIALVRYGGLRCPSEVLSLEWRHIDWARGRCLVPSPKTERYDGKGHRVIPLFPELREYLEVAFELAEPGDPYVVGGQVGRTYREAATRKVGHWRSVNLRTTFEKLIRKAGLEPWPRLFHNLRSSRETELLEAYPVPVVAQWMGHDPKVSLKHYAQITDEHFERASQSGAKSGALVAQNPAQQPHAGDGTDVRVDTLDAVPDGGYAELCDSCPNSANMSSGAGGIRTLGTGLPYTAFPVLPLQPLEHRSENALFWSPSR